MSHEGLGTSSIDTTHPYLIPRGSGEIHAWNVPTRDDGSIYIDKETGWPIVTGQHEEEIGGEIGIPSKPVSPKLLGDEIQSRLAEDLASGRVYKHEAHEVEGETLATDQEVGHAALDAVAMNEPMPANDEPIIKAEQKQDDSHEEKLQSFKEEFAKKLELLASQKPGIKSQAELLQMQFQAASEHITYGLTHDESDHAVISQYVVAIEGLNNMVGYFQHELMQLESQAEQLDSDEFIGDSQAARDLSALRTISAEMVQFASADQTLQMMRRFISPYDNYDLKDATEQLRSTAHSGMLGHHAGELERVRQPFTAWE
jgi:hypothetical protein